MHGEAIRSTASAMSLDKLMLASPIESFYASMASPASPLADEDYCASATSDYARTDSVVTSASSVGVDDISDYANDFDDVEEDLASLADSRDASPLPLYAAVKARRSLDLGDADMAAAVFCFVKNYVW